MSKRPKRVVLALFPTSAAVCPQKAQSADDYAVYVSYRPSLGRFVGTLKVVRLTDGRLLYPFEGAEEIGPFASRDVAREAAIKLGENIVRADLSSPEA